MTKTPLLIPSPQEHLIRLLYPFWLDAGPLDRAVESLCQLRHHQAAAPKKTWLEAPAVPELYREGILPQVIQVLFGFRQGTQRYLRIEPETLRHWFPEGGIVAQQGGQAYPLKPAGEGIELFLSPHGVGVLSLAFGCQPQDAGGLPALNHRLSQLRGPDACRLQIPQAAGIEAPSPQAKFEQRLGVPGGAFLWEEWVEFLLAPLHAHGLQETQPRLSVYSLTCFDDAKVFAEASQAGLKAFLSDLAEAGEQAGQDSLQSPEAVLSPSHWAAVAGQGSAHVLCGQAGQGLYTYFVPYLCAFLQRLVLQRLLWETDQTILETEDNLPERQAKLLVLRQDMLRFSVQSGFTEISRHEAYNRYYDLSLQTLRVAPSLERIQRVLHDMDAAATAEYQLRASQDVQALANEAQANRGRLEQLRRKLEWLEVLFIAFLATALAHYLGGELFNAAYAHWSLIAAPLVSGLTALLFIQPFARPAQGPEEGRGVARVSGLLLTCLMALLIGGWVAVGYWFFPAEHPVIEGASFLCASGPGCGREAAKGTI